MSFILTEACASIPAHCLGPRRGHFSERQIRSVAEQTLPTAKVPIPLHTRNGGNYSHRMTTLAVNWHQTFVMAIRHFEPSVPGSGNELPTAAGAHKPPLSTASQHG